MGIYDAIKDAVKIAQKADNVELIQKLLDVQQQVLDMQEKQQNLHAIIDSLESEKRTLRRELANLEEKSKQTDELRFEDESYWTIDESGERVEGPFCMSCFDVNKRKQRLTESHDGYYRCPACKETFLVDKKKNEAAVRAANADSDSWFSI